MLEAPRGEASDFAEADFTDLSGDYTLRAAGKSSLRELCNKHSEALNVDPLKLGRESLLRHHGTE